MLFASSGGINASTLVVSAKNRVTIAAAAERVADAPFNFSTSQCTCICRAQLMALVSEHPFALMAAGIFSAVTGLPEHATKKLAVPFVRASTLCSFLAEGISHTFGGPKVLLTGNSICRKRNLPRKDPRYGPCVYGPWGSECTGYVLTNHAGSHYNPRCNIGCRKSSHKFLN